MSSTQTEKRIRAGKNRSESASAVEGGGREQVDQAELSQHLAEIAGKSRRLVTDFLARRGSEGGEIGMANPTAIGAAFFEMTARLMSDPSRLVQAQMSLWNEYARLWQNTTTRLLGGKAEPVVEPAPEDRRFRDQAWSDSALFDFIKQSYLLTARSIQSAVKEVEGLDERTARKVCSRSSSPVMSTSRRSKPSSCCKARTCSSARSQRWQPSAW